MQGDIVLKSPGLQIATNHSLRLSPSAPAIGGSFSPSDKRKQANGWASPGLQPLILGDQLPDLPLKLPLHDASPPRHSVVSLTSEFPSNVASPWTRLCQRGHHGDQDKQSRCSLARLIPAAGYKTISLPFPPLAFDSCSIPLVTCQTLITFFIPTEIQTFVAHASANRPISIPLYRT